MLGIIIPTIPLLLGNGDIVAHGGGLAAVLSFVVISPNSHESLMSEQGYG
jgi:hypothetical protein